MTTVRFWCPLRRAYVSMQVPTEAAFKLAGLAFASCGNGLEAERAPMTDKELLKLAAKAAGIEIKHWIGDAPHSPGWNPLTDDGDALRLAVKLRIHVRHFPHDVEAQIERGYWREDDGFDPLAATRRVIVRAAAEIGKGMK